MKPPPTFTAMTGFTKLFGSIVTSTIWRQDNETRIVWITMLAIADRLGIVSASVPGLAALANLEIEECLAALEKLRSPDAWSRTKDHEGRRICDVDGGWKIVNYVKYRELGSDIDRRNYLRLKQREHRSLSTMSTNEDKVSTNASASVYASVSGEGGVGETQTRTFTKPTIAELKLGCAKCGLPDAEADTFFNYYESNGWRVGRNPMKSWVSALANWKKNYDSRRFQTSHIQVGRGQPSERSILSTLADEL
jgi:hypothetical protein